MSDLTITEAGVTKAQPSVKTKKGTIERVTVTSSATAFASGDVMCLSTEIPNATRIKGGLSNLVNVLILDESATLNSAAGQLQCVFTGKQTNMIGALSPGSSGGPDWSDADAKDANILGYLEHIDTTADCNLGAVSIALMSSMTINALSATKAPFLIKSEENSTSIYFTLIARDAVDLVALDDLTMVFHIEYLD